MSKHNRERRASLGQSNGLPPMGRVVVNLPSLHYMDVSSLSLHEYHPLPNGEGPPTELHMNMAVRELQHPVITRLKTRRVVQDLINALDRHMTSIWPETEKEKADAAEVVCRLCERRCLLSQCLQDEDGVYYCHECQLRVLRFQTPGALRELSSEEGVSSGEGNGD